MASESKWFAIRKELSPKKRILLTVLSFLLPIGIWCAFSYVPWLYHPMVEISDPGDVPRWKEGTLVKQEIFEQSNKLTADKNGQVAIGTPANPVYLPAPHEVAIAFYEGFTTPPRRRGQPWLHESIWHSIKVIFWGFTFSSLLGVPLGILCGTYPFFSRLHEPFIEFFRYLPAPAFGALAVAILGINDGPKVAIIFIGTFFQQVLVIGNTARKLDVALLEAAQTLGANKINLLRRVVVPGILPDLYKDMRILLGWAWTYLIVAELIGTYSGITWFIDQQSRYRNFDKVYAAIIIIGIIGLSTDMFLAWLGKHIFPWTQTKQSKISIFLHRLFGPLNQTAFLSKKKESSRKPLTANEPS
ncbi:MAG: ABC transporter permease [Verrucomicrobiota bacterium]